MPLNIFCAVAHSGAESLLPRLCAQLPSLQRWQGCAEPPATELLTPALGTPAAGKEGAQVSLAIAGPEDWLCAFLQTRAPLCSVSHKWKLKDSLRQNKPAVLHPSSIKGPKCETLFPGVFNGNFTVLCTTCFILNSENKRRTCFGCCWDFECFPWASNEKGEANSWIVRPSNL